MIAEDHPARNRAADAADRVRRAADMVRLASTGDPTGLCWTYGHEEVMGWESPRGDLGGLPELEGPFRDAHKAVTYCERCRQVWR